MCNPYLKATFKLLMNDQVTGTNKLLLVATEYSDSATQLLVVTVTGTGSGSSCCRPASEWPGPRTVAQGPGMMLVILVVTGILVVPCSSGTSDPQTDDSLAELADHDGPNGATQNHPQI